MKVNRQKSSLNKNYTVQQDGQAQILITSPYFKDKSHVVSTSNHSKNAKFPRRKIQKKSASLKTGKVSRYFRASKRGSSGNSDSLTEKVKKIKQNEDQNRNQREKNHLKHCNNQDDNDYEMQQVTLPASVESKAENENTCIVSLDEDANIRQNKDEKTFTSPVQQEWIPKFIPMQSPFNLVQESLYYDPWKHLIATMFLNRTKGTQALPLLWKFLDEYPSAEKAVQADVEKLTAFLRPLGLHNTRANRIIRFSQSYLKNPNFTTPRELFGMGKYAEDSWRLFCGERDDAWKVDSGFEPEDKVIRMYISWRRQMDELGFGRKKENPRSTLSL